MHASISIFSRRSHWTFSMAKTTQQFWFSRFLFLSSISSSGSVGKETLAFEAWFDVRNWAYHCKNNKKNTLPSKNINYTPQKRVGWECFQVHRHKLTEPSQIKICCVHLICISFRCFVHWKKKKGLFIVFIFCFIHEDSAVIQVCLFYAYLTPIHKKKVAVRFFCLVRCLVTEQTHMKSDLLLNVFYHNA